MRKILDYLDEKNLVVRQGQQLWHLHRALKDHSESEVIGQLAAEYQGAGRVQTLAEGMVLAGAVVTAYRSTEAGERVQQRSRAELDKQRAGRAAQEARLKNTKEAA